MRRPVGLALQGGGSWGAYTWGVLDTLLASRSIAITQFSGTSAGAINAAIVASALAKGTPRDARAALRAFWTGIADPAIADLVGRMWRPVERTLRASLSEWFLSAGLSPYNVNPLGINPLRDAIAAHVDVEALRSRTAPAVFITVTNVLSTRCWRRRACRSCSTRSSSTASRTGTAATAAIRRCGR